MKSTIPILALLIALIAGTQAAAQETETQTARSSSAAIVGKIELYKDPLVASYLSATLPGLGQVYVGRKSRGVLFLAGLVGTLGSAYAFYKPADLKLADYDNPNYGGNGDGLLGVSEIQNWQDKKYQDDAFNRLSTSRKVGAVTSLVAGLGVYIWNIVDAHNLAESHNRQLARRKVDLGLYTRPDQAGLALNVHF